MPSQSDVGSCFVVVTLSTRQRMIVDRTFLVSSGATPSREFSARDVYRPLHLTAADVEPELTRLVVEGRLTVREDPRFGSRYLLVTGDA